MSKIVLRLLAYLCTFVNKFGNLYNLGSDFMIDRIDVNSFVN